MRGGASKKGVYNIFGLDGTGLGRTTVSYQTKYAPGTIVVDTVERRLYLIQASGSALCRASGTQIPPLAGRPRHGSLPLVGAPRRSAGSRPRR